MERSSRRRQGRAVRFQGLNGIARRRATVLAKVDEAGRPASGGCRGSATMAWPLSLNNDDSGQHYDQAHLRQARKRRGSEKAILAAVCTSKEENPGLTRARVRLMILVWSCIVLGFRSLSYRGC